MKYQDNLPKLKLCNLKTHMIFLPKNEFFKLHNHRGDSKLIKKGCNSKEINCYESVAAVAPPGLDIIFPSQPRACARG